MEKLKGVLPEKYKNVINDDTIEIVDGNLIITPKEFGFKDGDFIVSGWEDKVSECEWICILKGYFSKEYYNKYAGLILSGNNRGKLEYIGYCDAQEYTRLATDSEKQLFIEKLKERGKRWNAETKQIEDILKVGDLAIFWDNDKSSAIISEFAGIDREAFVCKDYKWFNNAIKCISLEQYINFIK